LRQANIALIHSDPQGMSSLRAKREYVARMERSEIRGSVAFVPGFRFETGQEI
jgi:hypothetical protein